MKRRSKNIKKEVPSIILILILTGIILFLSSVLLFHAFGRTKIIREPAFAGSWYPGTEEALSQSIDSYSNHAKKFLFDGKIKAVIVPHAGYDYSGKIAALAFNQLESDYKTVFILGPSHRYALLGFATVNFTHFKTPLGEVKISNKVSDMIKKGFISSNEKAHENEHSLEIELPFLQKKLSNFEIVPILVGQNSESLDELLQKYLEENSLIVVSADLSHYHPYEEAKSLDAFSIDRIMNLDSEGIFKAEIDAPFAISSLLNIAKREGWKPILLGYANSGDITGDKSKVVGYAAIVFIEEKEEINDDEKKELLSISRKTLEAYLKTGNKLTVDSSKLSSSLQKFQGCFVTLNKEGNLRGCVGSIMPQEEIYKCVIDNSISAAVNDPRFNPVTYNEVKNLEIEISLLSVPEKFEFNSTDELLQKLRPNIDGVILNKDMKTATFLPQVWEQISNKEDFLEQLCLKAGMEKTCYTDNSLEVYTYQALVFSEKEQ